MLRNKRTRVVFEVTEAEEPSRRFPLGRVRLSDGHWRSGEMIRDNFEEVEDDSRVGDAGGADTGEGPDRDSERGFYPDVSDSGAEGEDDEGETRPEGNSGDAYRGDETPVLEDA